MRSISWHAARATVVRAGGGHSPGREGPQCRSRQAFARVPKHSTRDVVGCTRGEPDAGAAATEDERLRAENPRSCGRHVDEAGPLLEVTCRRVHAALRDAIMNVQSRLIG